MSVLRVTHYSGDRLGGAARAAYRLHQALRGRQEAFSRMVVVDKTNDDATVRGASPRLSSRLAAVLSPTLDSLPLRLGAPPDAMPRSTGWSGRIRAAAINAEPTDLVHLHWICAGFLSIETIGRIRKPVVWTLHDMWAFCGAEHLAEDGPGARWRHGYEPALTTGRLDVDRWAWRRKRAHWRTPMRIVTPSRWLAQCVADSTLMGAWPVSVIPNPLDLSRFKPMDRAAARRLLNLPTDKPLVLFGAIRGTQLSYKGWDLLQPALVKVAREQPGVEAVLFGQSEPLDPPRLGLPLHWMGHVSDDFTLSALYSAADLLVVPSRQESFGQTGSEAQACGCPVVAFDATGLRDVVAHGETGLLARPFDSGDLADAMLAVLRDDARRDGMSIQARARAELLWSYDAVARQYLDLYRDAVPR